MTVTASSFRAAYPAFASTTAYSDPMITAKIAVGVAMINPAVWGDDLTDYGVMLWVAHHLTIDARDIQVAAVGGIPGGASGPLQSKGAAGVSAAYDTKAVTEEGAGFWNQTSYGRELFRLMRTLGAGAIQVGTDGGYVGTNSWPGPYIV